LHEKLLPIYLNFCEEVQTAFSALQAEEDKKTFAAKAKSFPFSTILFHLKEGTCLSVQDFLETTRNKTILDLLYNRISSV
jgi:hypothetical protein